MKRKPEQGTEEGFLREWVRADRIETARLEVRLALDEYRELEDGGTLRQREKSAQENLEAIELHARELSKAIAKLPDRALYAILEHRNSTRQTGTITKWISDVNAVREDVLIPLAEAAKGALRCLPRGSGRGAPAKSTPSPRDNLVRRLAQLYRDTGNTAALVRGGREAPELAFVRELLHRQGIEIPVDLARVLRTKPRRLPAKKSESF